MSKLTITCREFKIMERNTLRGFATIHIRELRMTIKDVAIHSSHGKRWAQLPAKPQLDRDRRPVEKDGKLLYAKIFEFDSREISDAFSEAVIRAVDEHIREPA